LLDLVLLQVFQLAHLPLLQDQLQVNALLQAALEEGFQLGRAGVEGQETGRGALVCSPLGGRAFLPLWSLPYSLVVPRCIQV
jgi:hypothetical protein